MTWGVKFAQRNREVMTRKALEVLFGMAGKRSEDDLIQELKKTESIWIPHNYAQLESHYGRNVMVHRKGATLARHGVDGIIPGSMGTHTYLVRGKGDKESFTSCSHGAGRVLSRTKAKELINESMIQQALSGTFTTVNPKNADEAPQAYKSIDRVMANQSELVNIVHTLTPIITLKGD